MGANRSKRLDSTVVLFNTAGAVLAIMDYAPYISITVAIGSTCMALTDYFYIPSQLAATNKALEQVHNYISKWDSLSLVQRKTRQCKSEACLCVEGAILSITSARTA